MNINDIRDLHPEDVAKLRLMLQMFQQTEAETQPRRKGRTYLKGLVVDDATEGKLKFASLTTKTFRDAGYLDAVAHQNIFTVRKWSERGFRIKTGEKAVKVKGLVMFHVSQVEPIALQSKAEVREVTDEMVAAYLAKQAAAKAKTEAEAASAYGLGY
jgi:hypothetical protein